jgi:SAM-dependent methyltransferase
MTNEIWDATVERERTRLMAQAAMLDPMTIRSLEGLGIRGGWHCAEIGAGAGSIARWLCERVAPAGRVLATDVNTRFLDHLQHPVLEVRRHDILTETLAPGAFDLVHARLLLALLPEPEKAVRRMVDALRPGGWLLIEEYDQRTAGLFHPLSALQTRVSTAINEFFEANGADPYCGLKVVSFLRGVGLDRVKAEARLQVVELGSPEAEALALKLEQLRAKLVEAKHLSDEEIDQAIRHARSPGAGVHCPPLMVSAWGQRVR